MKRLAVPFLLAFLTFSAASPGCTSLPAAITIAGGVVSAIQLAIQAVQTFVNSGTVKDPTKLAQINKDIADAQAAAAAFQALVNGGAALNDANVTAALADFELAWTDLEGLLKDLGVVTAPLASRAAVSQVAGRLVLPSAEALMPPGADVPAVHAKAEARRAARAQARRSLDPVDGFIGLAMAPGTP